MKKYNYILVALDLTPIDVHLIRYASFLASVVGAEKVYFVHNIKKYEISSLFADQLEGVDLDQVVGEELNDKVSTYFEGQVPWEVFISEDPYTESLIQYVVRKYGISLTIVGNKNQSKGTGILPAKLLRMLRCDVFSLPSVDDFSLNSVWAGTDFSNASRKIFSLLELFQKVRNSTITAAHVYEVPVHFSPYVPREEMHPRIVRHSEKRFARFIKSLNFPGTIQQKIIPGRDASHASLLVRAAERANADLLVIGDKGGNTFSSLLIGSTAEEIFYNNIQIPLWVVK
ncbi:universal stress protein [Membranicola marinus]|uniref:Universal stress protein n=1 Tax=Membranihabitans marinus TaxID=1227546 RepID=A0A953LER4_9BACT|nr:universal stress protein [Membranihabitans marinus]MBY5960269.1 universal stress protein [Membranihabitans marinus]